MKKLFLFLAFSLALVSCSGEDSPAATDNPLPANYAGARFKLNGVQKTYEDVIAVDEEPIEGTDYVLYSVSARDEANRPFRISFDKASYLEFDLLFKDSNDVLQGAMPGEYTLNITEDTSTKISGTFSGTVYYTDQNGEIATSSVTEGYFSVTK